MKLGDIQDEKIMSVAVFGNASAITVPRQDRDSIRRFYCDVLGGEIVKEDNEKDIFCLKRNSIFCFATVSLMKANS